MALASSVVASFRALATDQGEDSSFNLTVCFAVSDWEACGDTFYCQEHLYDLTWQDVDLSVQRYSHAVPEQQLQPFFTGAWRALQQQKQWTLHTTVSTSLRCSSNSARSKPTHLCLTTVVLGLQWTPICCTAGLCNCCMLSSYCSNLWHPDRLPVSHSIICYSG